MKSGTIRPRAIPKTTRTPQVGIEWTTALAHPADPTGRVSGHELVRSDIAHHHRAGGDERVGADLGAADEGGVGADRRVMPDDRVDQFVGGAAGGCPRPEFVGEDAVRSEEHPVLDRHSRPDQDGVLDRDVVPDDRARLDERVISDVAPGTDPSARHHVRERPDPSPDADVGALAQSVGMDEERHFDAGR